MESPETALITEWLDKWGSFRSNYIQNRTRRNRNSAPTTRRVRKYTKWHRFNTQHIRKEIARNLGVLHGMAFDLAQDENLPLKEREKWTRLTAYIAQNINTISRSYDDVSIEETLKGLEKYVRENIEA